jgi:hypothetical protein
VNLLPVKSSYAVIDGVGQTVDPQLKAQ